MWYLKDHPQLGDPKLDQTERLERTFTSTKISRQLAAFQVRFLDIARKGVNLQEIEKRYAANCGLPTEQQEVELKEACARIKSMKNYQEFFEIIKLQFPGSARLARNLWTSVNNASRKPAYHMRGGGSSSRKISRGRPY